MVKKNELKGANKVTQSHSLVEALHKATPLSLQESRIVLTAISTIQPRDTIFDSQRIPVRDLLKLFNLGETNHKVIEKACDELITKGVKIKDGKGWTNFPWFQKIKYHHGEGVVEFQFPNDLKPYLLELKKEKGFTSYKLENILQLSSPYSHRIYELCFKWQRAGGQEFELEHLKELVGATQKSYKVYGSFKQRVLIPAIQDVNKKTDITIDFEEIKESRKVVGIRFSVQPRKKEGLAEQTPKKSENGETNGVEQPQLPQRSKKPDFDPVEEFANFIKN